jgi:putative endonuclease
MQKSQTNRKLGVWGERFAVSYIQASDGTILSQNTKYAGVEVDIVFESNGVLVVCEVKTRTSARFGHPLEVITAEKSHRLHRALNEAMRTFQMKLGRVDVIGIVLQPTPEVKHIKGILI